jgi:purine nucleoside permease
MNEPTLTVSTPQVILICLTLAGISFYAGNTYFESSMYKNITEVTTAQYGAYKAADDKEAARMNALTQYIALEAKRTNVEGHAKRAQLAEMRLQKACRINKGRC